MNAIFIQHKGTVKNYLVRIKTQISQKVDIQYLCTKPSTYPSFVFKYTYTLQTHSVSTNHFIRLNINIWETLY